jgi:LPXTG-motif cell wall-anchored protein
MILGQVEEEGTGWGNVAAGFIESAVGGLATGISRLIGGKDVEQGVVDNTPVPPEATADVTEDPISAGKTSARKPSASYETPDAGYASPGTTGASVWPWVLGLGVLAGGAYWFVKRRKRGKKGR